LASACQFRGNNLPNEKPSAESGGRTLRRAKGKGRLSFAGRNSNRAIQGSEWRFISHLGIGIGPGFFDEAERASSSHAAVKLSEAGRFSVRIDFSIAGLPESTSRKSRPTRSAAHQVFTSADVNTCTAGADFKRPPCRLCLTEWPFRCSRGRRFTARGVLGIRPTLQAPIVPPGTMTVNLAEGGTRYLADGKAR
jgi:hypothetical protein